MYDRDSQEYRDVPTFLLNKLDAYGREGMALGHFLTAIVENDLNAAFAHADGENRPHIGALTKYVYNQLPGICWGSRERVARYRKEIEAARRAARSVV